MQSNYTFLKKEKSPKILVEAVNLIGTKETWGAISNPIILSWAKELNISRVYQTDEVPWCGLFVGVVVKRAGFEPVKDLLWARNWAKFGKKQEVAMLGDVLTFSRGTGGHVGIYVGEDKNCYHVLGGNQGDTVSVVRVLKNRLISINRCDWKVSQPKNVRVINLSANGFISKNEA